MPTPKDGPAMTEAYEWRGREMVDLAGEKIGRIEAIYLDSTTDQPEWALVHTGLFGSRSHFVPLAGAAPRRGSVQVAVTKDLVTEAPSIDSDGELTDSEERGLYAHYGIDFEAPPTGSASDQPAPEVEPEPQAELEPTAEGTLIRSEEELEVAKRQVERGRARLRKHVVTEEVEVKVPVRREEIRLEREPLEGEDAAVSARGEGAEITEVEQEIILHEEQPVVEKRVVPKERVRVSKETVTEERTISEQVRKEQVEAEGEVE